MRQLVEAGQVLAHGIVELKTSLIVERHQCHAGNWLRHRVGLLALGNLVFPEPNVLGRCALLEEQQVGADGGVGFEDAVGQPDDGVQVALLQQVLL
jgi:hypothetical protein